MKAELTLKPLKVAIEKVFHMLIQDGKRLKSLGKVKRRAIEALSLPTIMLAGFLVRFFLSFVGWIRALLITWGIIDGFASNYIYREEKFFPYQFIRYARIVANFSGIFYPIIPIVWNIGDGIYSMMLYREASSVEDLPRLGRVINGTLQAIFI